MGQSSYPINLVRGGEQSVGGREKKGRKQRTFQRMCLGAQVLELLDYPLPRYMKEWSHFF